MTLQTYVVDFDYDECPDLEYDCHGDCCDQEILSRADGEEQRCPGWYNPDTWCQESPDYCMPLTYDNSYRYAPSLGAAEECYLECPPQCGYNEMTCYGKYDDGCDHSYCMPKNGWNTTYGDDYPQARQSFDYGNYDGNYGNDSCPMTCPTLCSELDIACPIGWDENGCSWGEYCIQAMYPLGEIECPGVCATPCDWGSGEITCPIFSEDGCYIGNTCQPGGQYRIRFYFLHLDLIPKFGVLQDNCSYFFLFKMTMKWECEVLATMEWECEWMKTTT